MLTDFQNSFAVTLDRKFAIKTYLQISSNLNDVAALPCEILISEEQRSLYAEVLFTKI